VNGVTTRGLSPLDDGLLPGDQINTGRLKQIFLFVKIWFILVK
jgi:hypothetical protein